MSTLPQDAVSVTPPQSGAPSPQQRVASAAALIDKMAADLGPDPKGTALGVTHTHPAGAQTPEAPKTEAKPSFADAIKEMRSRREKAQAEAAQRSQWEAENARLRQELDAVRGGTSFEDDPVAYAKSRGWTPEQQLLFGKTLLYDLAPDKADPDFRFKMFEAKQEREKKAESERERAQRQEREVEENRRMIMDYAAGMESAVMGFEAGTYPASEVEYGEDVEGYLQELLRTAHRMADAAAKAQQVADLAPASVAKKLEADIAAKEAARSQRRAGRQPQAPQAQATPVAAPAQVQTPARSVAEQSDISTVSSKNMGGSGTPLPPAMSERERIQRAVAAGWGGR